MNPIPEFNRRAFVIGTAAVGTGLALGLDIPFGGPTVVRAADGSPEVNAWMVIRPDDTVVIRIARSEMGQGTLTGLALLVAEELECDWWKVRAEYADAERARQRNRIFGSMSTGGSRGIRTPRICAQGRRRRARDAGPAAANEWGVPVASAAWPKASSRISVQPQHDLRQGRSGCFQVGGSRKTPSSKTPSSGSSIGTSPAALRHSDKTTASRSTRRRADCPDCRSRRSQQCPVFGGKVKSYDESKVRSMRGVKKVVRATTGWQSSPTTGGTPIRPSSSCRSSGTWARTARCRASRSCSSCARRHRFGTSPSRQRRTATQQGGDRRCREGGRGRVLRIPT